MDDRTARIARVRMRASYCNLLSAMGGEERYRQKSDFISESLYRSGEFRPEKRLWVR
jgi:hypothetical protein